MRDRRLGALRGVRQGAQELGSHMRHVGREHDDAVGIREPERRGDADDGGAGLAAVVQHGEGQLEPVGRLADDDHVLEGLGEDAVAALGQRLPFVPRERLRRAEAPARPADEEGARYVLPTVNHARASSSKGPSGTESRRRYSRLRASRRSSSSAAAYAPAGPTPAVNGAQRSSNPS